MYQNIAILAGFAFLYSVVSGKLERTPINGAIVFTAFGLAMGTSGLGVLKLSMDMEELRVLAELALSLVLFTDAANANLRVLRQSFHIPQRLLLLGLPLTIVLGFGAGACLFQDLTWLEIAVLATMLAPTDAALGKAVVTDEAVPADVREGLNVESGLNDGICVPILFVFLALATHTGGEGSATALALKLVAQEIGIGVAVGVTLTLVGGGVLAFCARRQWSTETWVQLPVIMLSTTCFALAQHLGGSGFIAAFVAGLLFGAMVKHHKHRFLLAAEGTGDTLALLTWVAFGAVVVGQAGSHLSWRPVLYAVLSLTVVRMVSVFLTLHGMRLRGDEKLFMGWFGPRGLASVVFAVIVGSKDLPGNNTIAITVVCTIVLSVVAHGLSAHPLVRLLAARLKHNPVG